MKQIKRLEIDGEEYEIRGDQMFIRYSAHPDGTDYTVERQAGQNYIGIASAEEEPTDKSQYEWFQITGELGDVETALDSIIEIQNALIGGTV